MRVLIVLGLALLWPASPAPGQESAAACSPQDLAASLTSADKVYQRAMLLAQRLRSRDVIVRCVLRSTKEGMFDKQDGAALYRTSRGDFEALFLPRSLTFKDLTVVERTENGRYVYSFSGGPKPWPANRIDSVRRMYFIKHGPELLVTHDTKLAALLAPQAASLDYLELTENLAPPN